MAKFVDPNNLIAYTAIPQGSTVADFGCGGGFFTLAAAKAIGGTGTIYAVDILQDKLSATLANVKQGGLKNVMVVHADLEKPLEDIPEGTCDLVILASILHEIGNRDALIRNAYKVLKTGGKILAVEWTRESSLLGPAMDRRVLKDDLEKMFNSVGLKKEKDVPADSFHYSVIFVK